jgi:hypothetical protein
MCFVGDDRVAVSGIGSDDIALLDGIRIFHAATGTEVGTIAGPRPARSSPTAAACTPPQPAAWRSGIR